MQVDIYQSTMQCITEGKKKTATDFSITVKGNQYVI